MIAEDLVLQIQTEFEIWSAWTKYRRRGSKEIESSLVEIVSQSEFSEISNSKIARISGWSLFKAFETLDSLPSVEDDAMEKRSAVGLNSIMRIMGVWEQKPVSQAFYSGKWTKIGTNINTNRLMSLEGQGAP